MTDYKTADSLPGAAPSAKDIAALGKFGIPPELVAAARIRRVTDGEARTEFGIRFAAAKDCSGLAYPYYIPSVKWRVTVRIRRDHPELDANGKPKNKYLSPYGDTKHLYFPPGAKELLDDPETIGVLVESEKAALAITACAKRNGMKLVALATGGCWGWRNKHARSGLAPNGERVDISGPVDDLKFLNGHKLIIMLDSNWRIEINPKVYWARAELTVEMNRPERRCTVLLCDLPVESGINGPDDFIAAHGDQAMVELLAQAHKPAYTSAQQQATAESARTATEYSEDALALKFTEKYADQLRYTAQWGRWSLWNGHGWEPDTTCHVYDRARGICRAESAKVRCGGNVPLARKLASASTIAAVERLARADRQHAAKAEQWDADPWLLNTPDGIVDLRTGTRRPARREDYATRITAVAPGGNCPLWLSFLDRITTGNRELQSFMQRMAGYSLTGNTREHALFFLYGTGANGKGTFVNTITGLMGSYARTASIEILIDSKNDRHPTELAWLQGARLVTATETEEGRRWAEAKLKMLTGGDPIAARYMRCDFFEYVPQFKLIVQGNYKPGLRSVDEAIRRRFNLVPFTITIPEAERDKELGDKLREEWSGILGWAIAGCLAWQREGLSAPDVVRSATEDYLATEDVVGRWLEDRCDIIPSAWSPISELYDDWRKWTEAAREYQQKERWLSEKLASRGFNRKIANKARGFCGITLRCTAPVTQVTHPPIIGVTRAHTHVRTNNADVSPASPEPNSASEPDQDQDEELLRQRKLRL